MSSRSRFLINLVHAVFARWGRHAIVTSLIFAFGLVAAYVCFGLLESQASVNGPYAAGGAFAGAVISWGVLTSVYLQVSKSTDELDALRARAEELQQKLIRGSPRPTGFEVEVNEHQRLVLAIPADWEPRGGTIFEFQSPSSALDPFPARFRAYYSPIVIDEKGILTSEQRQMNYYERLRSSARSEQYATAHSTEIVHLGDPLGGVKSLRFASQEFARVWRARDALTGREEWQFSPVSRRDFHIHVQTKIDQAIQEVLSHQPDAGERARVTRELREPTTERFTAQLERGALDPGAGLSEAITTYLRDEVGLGAEGAPSEGDQEETLAAASAKRGARPDRLSEAALATREVKGAPEPSLVGDVEVVPIGRVMVVCYHEDLGSIYYFEVMDNASDYTTSSELFNRILSSVRFLS